MDTQPVALVTGAASGVGLATVERLRARGYRTIGLDLSPAPAGAADIHDVADVTDPAAVAAAIADGTDRLGGLSAVAHCAGAFPREVVPLHLLSPEQWDRTIAINLTGAFTVARAALPHLLDNGRGSLVFVASVAGEAPQPGAVAYAAAKSGVIGLARGIALEYGPRGIRSNAVCPGWIDTPMAAPVLGRPDLRERIEHDVPLRRVAPPDDIAAAITHLATDDARYITGEALRVDGGAGLTAYTSGAEVDTLWARRAGISPPSSPAG